MVSKEYFKEGAKLFSDFLTLLLELTVGFTWKMMHWIFQTDKNAYYNNELRFNILKHFLYVAVLNHTSFAVVNCVEFMWVVAKSW